jgi:hypothetical protein
MNLLELIEETGLKPRKTSNSHGGEYHCPCPSCGGDDRFMFWPQTGRYWCRQCEANGDEIQFCKDFQGLPFHSALAKVKGSCFLPIAKSKTSSPRPITVDSSCWEQKADKFVKNSHHNLLTNPNALNSVQARGLSIETIKHHHLGWNPRSLFPQKEEWGFEKKSESDERRKILLPPGIVIPAFQNNMLRKIKIRRSDWKEDSDFGKYHIVCGSLNFMPVFGDLLCPVTVIVEAEFDAMLVAQEVNGLCSCLSVGGVSKPRSSETDEWLRNRDLILFALDFDDAGKKKYPDWQETYPNLRPWPVPKEKSPGDYFKAGGDINRWIASGMKAYL